MIALALLQPTLCMAIAACPAHGELAAQQMFRQHMHRMDSDIKGLLVLKHTVFSCLCARAQHIKCEPLSHKNAKDVLDQTNWTVATLTASAENTSLLSNQPWNQINDFADLSCLGGRPLCCLCSSALRQACGRCRCCNCLSPSRGSAAGRGRAG